MRIQINAGSVASERGFAPIDPPPPLEIDALFELETFQESVNPVEPFTTIGIEWSIRPLNADTNLEDYSFSLLDTYGVLAEDIAPTGSHQFFASRNTLIRIRAREQGSGVCRTLTKP